MDHQNPKILVSHSGRQYVHQLLNALRISDFSFTFLTSFAYKPGTFPFTIFRLLPESLWNKLEKEFRKRSFEGAPNKNIRYFPYFEIIRELTDKIFKNTIAEKMLFYRDRIHDKWASTKVTTKYSVVIGYEECCLHTFRKAKKLGLTTILDLAQIHYKEIEAISQAFPVFSEIYNDQKIRARINKIKQEEMQLSDYIICLSEFAKASLTSRGFAADKIFVVNLGFDPQKFSVKTHYDSSPTLKIAYTGTLTKRKGVDLLLKLKSDLTEKVSLTFIGPMADAADLFEKHKGQYTWYPYLEHGEMNAVLKKNDIFVFPSYLDSWAMVVIEAMACGLPVIVTENTGSKDAIDKQSGFVIEAGNYTELKENILHFYTNREVIEIMGKHARLTAEGYTWNNYYSQINKSILEILRRQKLNFISNNEL